MRVFSKKKGSDIYCMPSFGGESHRLTYFGKKNTSILGWTQDKKILLKGIFSTFPLQLFTVALSAYLLLIHVFADYAKIYF